jgi:membrane-bound lytic murein transglycosylase B
MSTAPVSLRFTFTRVAVCALTVALLCPPAAARTDVRGYGYLIEKLVADGVERDSAIAAYRRVPRFSHVLFSVEPGESRAPYRKLLGASSVSAARRCRGRHDSAFRAAESRSGVPASVLSAVIHVETRCGAFTGRHIVLHRLSRLAMANEPANVRYNIQRRTRGLAPAERIEIERKIRDRARYLEETFYPEVRATFELAKKLGFDPLGIRGSRSGAFGVPQFLPSSYLRFAVDGNGNGKISLYEFSDAIASTANYLAAHGWSPGLSTAEKRQALWAYNRSDAYIDTVLTLTRRIEQTYPSVMTGNRTPAGAATQRDARADQLRPRSSR